MKNLVLCLSFMCVLLLLTTTTAYAATHNVQVDPGGFYPAYLEIQDGDTVEFFNYTGYPLLTIYHDTGPCWGWMIDVPYNGSFPITLPCGAGTEVYRDNVYGFSGTLQIVSPGPTPTPGPIVPVTSPGGIAITILIISLLMGLSVFKK
jgi:hypothetical protein